MDVVAKTLSCTAETPQSLPSAGLLAAAIGLLDDSNNAITPAIPTTESKEEPPSEDEAPRIAVSPSSAPVMTTASPSTGPSAALDSADLAPPSVVGAAMTPVTSSEERAARAAEKARAHNAIVEHRSSKQDLWDMVRHNVLHRASLQRQGVLTERLHVDDDINADRCNKGEGGRGTRGGSNDDKRVATHSNNDKEGSSSSAVGTKVTQEEAKGRQRTRKGGNSSRRPDAATLSIRATSAFLERGKEDKGTRGGGQGHPSIPNCDDIGDADAQPDTRAATAVTSAMTKTKEGGHNNDNFRRWIWVLLLDLAATAEPRSPRGKRRAVPHPP